MPRAEAKYRITADDQTGRGIRSAETRLQRLRRSVVRFGSRFAGAIGVGAAAITGIVAGLRSITGGLDDAAKAAADFGLQASDLEQYRITADLLGTDLNRLLRIQERLARAADEAADGVAEYADEFERLGIDAERFAELDLRGQLSVLDQQLRRLPEGEARAARVALAGRGTGRIFRGNLADTFGTAADIVDATGLNEAAAAAERFNDALTLTRNLLGQTVATEITRPLAQGAAERLVPAIERLNDLLQFGTEAGRERGTFRLEEQQFNRLVRASGTTYERN